MAYKYIRGDAIMSIKELRISKSLTQKAAAALCGIPLRTYIRYENNEQPEDSVKYQFILQKLSEHGFVDEEHGILTGKDIAQSCEAVFRDYPVDYCYLFGSYAKGLAHEKSDVDLLVSTQTTGLKFFGLVESLRQALKKKVDVLDVRQLAGNPELLNEILKDGVKIYEQNQG